MIIVRSYYEGSGKNYSLLLTTLEEYPPLNGEPPLQVDARLCREAPSLDGDPTEATWDQTGSDIIHLSPGTDL